MDPKPWSLGNKGIWSSFLFKGFFVKISETRSHQRVESSSKYSTKAKKFYNNKTFQLKDRLIAKQMY